ncbi:LuxR C-terminal-related transcriptional regulator [Microbacterium awajiense]|uniref:LuxR C-terminal-related transcriptional regulator n=1 Tax=Microbacterium awajiense TaxID=415214 RepID=A0ABP7AZE7_9MICO
MATALQLGRARSDIDVMSRAGLPLNQFMDEAAAALDGVVPAVAGCLSTLDPATGIVSSTRKRGDLDGRNDGDITWAHIEYGEDDPTAMMSMISGGVVAVGVRVSTDGAVDRSIRLADFLMPRFDYHDEARVVFSDRSGAWGSLCLFRGSDDEPFSQAEVDFLAEVAPMVTRGIRVGLLAHHSAGDAATAAGPAVIIVDAEDRIVQQSGGATTLLSGMGNVPNAGDPLAVVYSLVTGARRYAAGRATTAPRVRLRAMDGTWLVMHATPLTGTGDRAGDVVVAIEQARPQEVIRLVADAFGLTSRERDVIAMVLRGADTKQIATSMNVSPYTVQDHLKSIFEKAGVTSRRELVSRVYADQYAPRWGADVGPDGWFAA